jgi:hypothetical protein
VLEAAPTGHLHVRQDELHPRVVVGGSLAVHGPPHRPSVARSVGRP